MEDFLISVGDILKEELAFPNWSAKIFISDLQVYPPSNINTFYVLYGDAARINKTYLEFFHDSRGYIRPQSNDEFQVEIWKIFSQGSVMLYFEDIFIRLLSQIPTNDDITILQYIKILSINPISQWDNILSRLGACCYEFFAKEPYLYLALLQPKTTQLTDQQMLTKLGLTLLNKQYPGKCSRQDSRSELIKIYQLKMNSKH